MTDEHEWDDDVVDERLRALAKDYHRPEGTVPREAMWGAIAPSLRAAPVVLPLRRTHAARWRWAGALAAGLLIGVALDRGLVSRFGASSAVPAGSARAGIRVDTPHVASGAISPSVVSAIPEAGIAAPTGRSSSTTPSGSRLAVRDPRASTTESPLPSTADASLMRPRADGRSGDLPAQSLYALAARQTLTQAEALLTSYRRAESLPRDQEAMRQAARWARDVLTSTRLLLDSPAARDPQLRALFTDLELVLAQIVQLSGTPLEAGERELIERAMRDRDLLPRIRSAVPAGLTAS
jgi:hypothetical protein